MTPMMEWFKDLFLGDPRRTNRNKTPPLVAYFWDGGRPVAHTIQNISHSGFYLATTERWLLGTLIMMTLQRTSAENGEGSSIIVMSKVVRYGEDGVGFAFIPVESTSPSQDPRPGAHAADRKTLEKFLHRLKHDL